MKPKSIRSVLGTTDFEKFQRGERKIFNIIFEYYYPILVRYIASHSHNFEDAEELTQETFVILHKHRHRVESADKLYPFLFVIAKRLTLSYFRKQIRRQTIWEDAKVEIGLIQSSTMVDDYINHRELESIYHKIVDSLPEQQRKAYSLFKIDERPQEEVAVEMSVSRNTVRNHISMATKTIRLKIQQLYFINILIQTGTSIIVASFI